PVSELVERLPRGLCKRLLALPVRHDAITGTIDVVVADTADAHPATEIGFHLGAPVRVVRAPVSAIEDALRRLRMSSSPSLPPPPMARAAGATNRRPITLPPPVPELSRSLPGNRDIPPRRGGLVIETDSSPPPPLRKPAAARMRTPPWGTPIHA